MSATIWSWWPAVELLFLLAVFLADRWFRLSCRLSHRFRSIGSERMRVGARTAVYSAVAAAVVLLYRVDAVAQGAPLLRPIEWSILGVMLGGSFMAAMLQTSREDGASKATSEPARPEDARS